MSKLFPVVLWSAGAWLLVACASSQSPPANIPILDKQDAFAALQHDVMLKSSAVDDRLIDAATDKLVMQCMKAQGFKYELPSEEAQRAYDEKREQLERETDRVPAVDADPPLAERIGYGIDVAKLREFANDRHEPLDGNVDQSDAAQAALGGKNRVEAILPNGRRVGYYTDGCLAESRRALFGDLDRLITTGMYTDNLPPTIRKEVDGHPAYAKAQDGWVQCMKSAGQQGFKSPSDAVSKIKDMYLNDAANVAQTERQVAVADYKCQAESNFKQALQQACDAVRAKYTATPDPAVLEYSELRKRALTEAERVMRG